MPSAKNFSYGTVLTAPSPATTGTSLVLNSAQGALFPAVPFNATVWPSGVQPSSSNGEVVTVTAISTDTFTIVRGAEGSSARTVIVGDQVAATITADVITQSNRFTPTTAAIQNITLDRSTDFTAQDTAEVGSGYSLELPATSTLEVVPTVKQAEVQSYFAFYDTIEGGCIWTADSAGSTLNGTLSDGYVWINGRRLRVNCVRSHAFTASKDTYVDFSDNGDGTAKVTYTEATNNAASPTLASGSVRNAIVVSGAASIAASTSINQGQESMILPIASSIPYAVTDSLGNLICPRDPGRRLLGYKQTLANVTSASGTEALITGLSCPVIVPTGRKVVVSFFSGLAANDNVAGLTQLRLWLTAVTTGTQLQQANFNQHATVSEMVPMPMEVVYTPTTTSNTFVAGLATNGTGTSTLTATANVPLIIKVELI